MEINTQAIIYLDEKRMDKYIDYLEELNIFVDQYTQNNKRVIFTKVSVFDKRDEMFKIFKNIKCIDIYWAMNNHATELVIKEA